jgi:hypothetical protein
VKLRCAKFGLSRAAYYAEARRQRGEATSDGKVIALPRRPRYTAAEVVLARIREVLARETALAWGVRKVWATLRREGLKGLRKRVHALMRAHGLVLARDREPGEPRRGHVVVPEPTAASRPTSRPPAARPYQCGGRRRPRRVLGAVVVLVAVHALRRAVFKVGRDREGVARERHALAELVARLRCWTPWRMRAVQAGLRGAGSDDRCAASPGRSRPRYPRGCRPDSAESPDSDRRSRRPCQRSTACRRAWLRSRSL